MIGIIMDININTLAYLFLTLKNVNNKAAPPNPRDNEAKITVYLNIQHSLFTSFDPSPLHSKSYFYVFPQISTVIFPKYVIKTSPYKSGLIIPLFKKRHNNINRNPTDKKILLNFQIFFASTLLKQNIQNIYKIIVFYIEFKLSKKEFHVKE
ncbi:hypothetical protein pb186bvf_017109 [Paramecium bursaria]